MHPIVWVFSIARPNDDVVGIVKYWMQMRLSSEKPWTSTAHFLSRARCEQPLSGCHDGHREYPSLPWISQGLRNYLMGHKPDPRASAAIDRGSSAKVPLQ
jgi:hypothetical protein